MSTVTLIENINRNNTYPVRKQTIAIYNCGTISLILTDTWTEQMLNELPAINVQIYTTGGSRFYGVDINLATEIEKILTTENFAYELPIYDIPRDIVFVIRPIFDKYALSSHNNLVRTRLHNDMQPWDTETEEFPVKIVFNNDNIKSGGAGESGPVLASNVIFDPTGTNLLSTNVQNALIEIYSKTYDITTLTEILEYTSWNTVYYTINNPIIKENSTIHIGLPSGVTLSEYGVTASANIAIDEIGDGFVKFICFGEVPEIDIPITVTVQTPNS